jgi:phosphatidylserine/phosphatidylglycerophosphate/cardiolipin synthase-like enzyme
MMPSRATASIKALAALRSRESSNLQASKPVPTRLVIYLLLALLLSCAPNVLAVDIAVCFTPEYGMTPSCTQEVVDALTGAKKSVLVQAYSFTSAPIAKALVDAHKRGVDVKVILDRSNRTAHYSAATLSGPCRHSRLDRHPPRHRSQQDNDHRRQHDPYRKL